MGLINLEIQVSSVSGTLYLRISPLDLILKLITNNEETF
jgi:hypothetical protein